MALVGVAVITALILPLRQVTPVVATGVLYLVVVLLVSVVWGVWLGLATSVVSALAFNYFHIPPTGRLTIAHTENVVALVVFFIAAVVASSLADLVRARTPAGRPAPARGRPDRRARAAAPGRADLGGGAAGRRPAPRASARASRGRDPPRRGRARCSARPCSPWPTATTAWGRSSSPCRSPTTGATGSSSVSCRRSTRSWPRRCERERLQAEVRRDPGAAPQRRDQDRASALGLARPAHAADRDRHRRRGAGRGRT